MLIRNPATDDTKVHLYKNPTNFSSIRLMKILLARFICILVPKVKSENVVSSHIWWSSLPRHGWYL